MANIFVVEDMLNFRAGVKHYLEEAGHSIAIEEKTLDGALIAVQKIDELDITVAVVDGNLTTGDNSGKDGQTISEAIRQKRPDVKIITYSSAKYSWGDVFVWKNLDDFSKLVEAVKQ